MTLESSFPPDKRVENEIDSLLEEGHAVDILCSGEKGSSQVDLYKSATIFRITPGPIILKSSVAALKIPLYFFYWKFHLSKILRNKYYDAVHVHDLPLIKPVLQLKRTFGFKVVLDLHENWPALLDMSLHTKTFAGKILCSISQWEKYEMKYAPLADRIIVVVEEARERIIAMNVPQEKIFIVSNTINLNDYKFDYNAKDKSGQDKTIIYEGGITYHRGIQYILHALSIMKQDLDVKLRIIGSGSYLEKLKQKSIDTGIEHLVEFMGWQPQEKVYELINNADIAIIPHIKSPHTDTTVPHKLFHYMYAGLPILASNCRPLERIINETSSGLIYNYDNAADLIEKIKLLIGSKTGIDKAGSREWVINKYNWSHDEKELLNLYTSL